jgi:error-prone DNA polymerase
MSILDRSTPPLPSPAPAVWPSFEPQRRVVLSAGMMAVRGKIQREGAVVHLVAHHLTDLSEELASVGERDGGFPLPHGRGDQIRDGGSLRTPKGLADTGTRDARHLRSDLHIDTIKVKTHVRWRRACHYRIGAGL